MKPLPISKAIQLYKILAPYLPDEVDEDDFNFVGTIIENIKNSGNHNDYIEAVAVMTGKEFDQIVIMNPIEIVAKFTEGLMVNKILDLGDFCKKVGIYARS